MTDQAKALRGLMERRLTVAGVAAEPFEPVASARTISITSGKGGVGKSVVALNLAIALAQNANRVCLLDANLGLGNIDLLCGLNGYWNLSHVVTGARSLKDIVLEGPAGVNVIPGASGLIDVADCPPAAQHDIFRQLEELEGTHDFIIVDTGTGIHRSVRHFVSAADMVLIVSTPEPTSIADAYATVKALSGDRMPRLELLINQAETAQQAQAIIDRLQQTSRLFLQTEVGSAGYLLKDPYVSEAVVRRMPFVLSSPDCPAARQMQQLARRVSHMSATSAADGPFFPRLCHRPSRAAA